MQEDEQKEVIEEMYGEPHEIEAFEKINAVLSQFEFMNLVESKTRVHKVHWVLLLALVLIFSLVYFLGVDTYLNMVAFMYPAYMSYKTLESEDIEDHIHWLTYWVVYAVFGIVERVTDTLLFWIPYYYAGKMLFLVWCFLPQTKGCRTVYAFAVRPALVAHQNYIDSTLEQAGRSARQAGSEIRDVSAELVGAVVATVARTIASSGSALAAKKQE